MRLSFMKILGYLGIAIGVWVGLTGIFWVDFIRWPELMRNIGIGFACTMLGAICINWPAASTAD